VANIDEHDHHGLDVFQPAAHDTYFFIFFEQSVISVDLKPDVALCLFFDSLQQFFLFFLDVRHHLVHKNKFAFNFALGVVELGWFFFDRISD